MLGSKSIIGFVQTKNLARAKAFFGKKLGLRLVATDAVALVFASGGTMVRVVKVEDFSPAPYTILGWPVDDIGKTIAALKTRGAVFERYPRMEQDERGIWRAPGGAHVAWFKDLDGNVLSISQNTRV